MGDPPTVGDCVPGTTVVNHNDGALPSGYSQIELYAGKVATYHSATWWERVSLPNPIYDDYGSVCYDY